MPQTKFTYDYYAIDPRLVGNARVSLQCLRNLDYVYL